MRSLETVLLLLSLVDFVFALAVGLFRPRAGRFILLAGLALLATALIVRGVTIGYLPFTQRAESLAGFVLFAGCVTLMNDYHPVHDTVGRLRLQRFLILLPQVGLLTWSVLDWPEPREPVALLRTIWYLLHVPISFVSYGLWNAAFGASIVRLTLPTGAESRARWDRRIEGLLRWGFLLFSISMIFGGIWGHLAWGYVFLWDPKMLWSISLWTIFAALVHLGAGEARHRLRAILVIPGWVILWIAFLGAGFFRTSIHGF